MPVSVVVGGQYGSEGKGKVALDLVRRDPTTKIVVRPGGTNSGHTAYRTNGSRVVLRQLPAAAIDRNVKVVLPAGSYIDVDLLRREIAEVGLRPDQLVIDPKANVIRPDHVHWERGAGLVENIGSTASGTGAAVISRLARCASSLPHVTLASEAPELLPFLKDAVPIFTSALAAGDRILIEGTQGFGLSPIHGESWPKCTSRDTTAAAFLSECGLSPLNVDRIVLVLRCHPIRVAGDSGPLLNETSWEDISSLAGVPHALSEFTSVTHKLRRVGNFDGEVVRQAIAVNAPTDIVLNHVDYIDWHAQSGLTDKARRFIRDVEMQICRPVNFIGLNPYSVAHLREGVRG